jgi:hypothetical protein
LRSFVDEKKKKRDLMSCAMVARISLGDKVVFCFNKEKE